MREFIDGNTAIVRGALAAGCDFFAGYPITPATPILLGMMRDLPRVGGVAVQGEDEIASFGFCIGAAMTGRRVLTATSGPGISLYSENIGLAIMGEVPLVIVDVQRMGPATGGATTAAQGDVQFIRWCTSGGYPIVVLSPATVADCYTLTMRAFDLLGALSLPGLCADRQRGRLDHGHRRGRRFHTCPRPRARDRRRRVLFSALRLSGAGRERAHEPLWRAAPAALYHLYARRARLPDQGLGPREPPQPAPDRQDRTAHRTRSTWCAPTWTQRPRCC